ncbi:MAG: CHAP domain-containing protein [Thermoanaerobaculia bacterium]|nr:CHAP domain-containing protein [Thermoanaerobaculia bacterium]
MEDRSSNGHWKSQTLSALGLAFLLALMTPGTQALELSGTVDDDGGLEVQVTGVFYPEVVDFKWNDDFVTGMIANWMDDGVAFVRENADGFELILSRELGEDLRHFENGLFSIVLENGVTVTAPLTLELRAQDVRQTGMMPKVASCGGQSSSGNPYPCCDNNSNGVMTDNNDGNCTWWSWKKAKDGWGWSLPGWGHAKTWDDSDKRAINRSSGYVLYPSPILNSIAVSNTYGSSTGHVAWVTSVGSSTVTVSEMNCSKEPIILPNVRSKSHPRSIFQSYLVGMQIYDFWVKSTSITASPGASVASPNFDAQFKIKNITNSQKYQIKQLALAVHNSSGAFLWNFFRAPGNSTAALYTPGSLSTAAADGLDGSESIAFPKSYAFFTTAGTYRIVPKIQLLDNTWVELGYYTLTVRSP